ncbi:CRISPR-associated helicase Cas3' [Paenibacillus bouchesdurhonensis]|uniref:CRISPR-associated helicase Cas3' n=1 Tax=Paenibacillus bouchesdurhonensis TaxID=1870990 RepID=UPI000DA61918|nr:CRISPR-associated helicase Cas3' [Paenibacillus bouchesdurhonensis]
MIFYAKSYPPLPHTETVQQHTNALLKCYETLKNGYASALPLMTEREWQMLRWAVQYHDVGKYDAVFQNKILKALRQEQRMRTRCSFDVRHNYVSVLAIPFKKLGLNDEEKRILAQAVAYHHEREDKPDKKQVKQIYTEHILPHREQIEHELEIELDEKAIAYKLELISNRIQESDGEVFHRYVLIKGLLHRLDHAASAHVSVELAPDMNIGEYVEEFVSREFSGRKNELQQFTQQNQDKHVVVVAQTGMGKTEAGLLWLGKDKGFFTLPLRVSINAMYQRITDKSNIGFTRSSIDGTGEEATGLLHSTSLDYLHDELEADDEALEKIHSQSREYANKLIISTIDQILKFPFFYLGFEKEYAAVASSKIIIDELQAYDPKIAALIIRALILIDEIGGSFMIMTATLPNFYYKALLKEKKSPRLPIACGEFINDQIVRHHVEVREESILEEDVIDRIVAEGGSYKVLVICNTVKRAREVYLQIKSRYKNTWLLHSRFVKKDRVKREKDIIQFASGTENGIWITTQLVEASLDIDFDRLYTEMSSLDSQFQRYGRCNRKGLKAVDDVNIRVYIRDVSGVNLGGNSVYHKDIYSRSLQLFEQHKTGVLLESVKQTMIAALYDESALENSDFKKLFDSTLEELKNRPMYDMPKLEAQQLLRDIQEVQAIPGCFRGEKAIEDALEVWKTTKDKRIKREQRRIIENYTVGVNRHLAKNQKILSQFPLIHGLYFIDADYSQETGLLTQSVIAPMFL